MDQLKIIFINSHPIQYFSPLYSYLNLNGSDTSCWYCSDETIRGHHDREFQSSVKWDIPILEGYQYRFFKNYSWSPSFYNGFFGLFNPGMIVSLFKQRKSVVVVHGWAYLTNILVIIFARLAGHRVCLRAESPLNQELLKSKRNIFLKRLFLQGFLFRFIHKFLFIGQQNKAFYEHYGVSGDKLVFVPYAVDNDRFQNAAKRLLPEKAALRASLGLDPSSRIILSTAKYIGKKRPLDLLAAYHHSNIPGKCLVMVGEGELRKAMESYIAKSNVENVFLTGFINQSDIEKYYAAADAFVLCSGAGETWGLSVNEAMNFDLPLIVSSIAGCSSDLVEEGVNGFVFKEGNIEELQTKLSEVLKLDGSAGRKLIDVFSFNTIAASLSKLQMA